ncbi:hypothetical protein C0995_011310 [Termitomyces sp. Mi166|nr:hypothetical protein C0995_011310 [Termitomyces sp. Mi166\
MENKHDSSPPPPPYDLPPTANSVGLPSSSESACALSERTGCLPAYQSRPIRQYHPYSRSLSMPTAPAPAAPAAPAPAAPAAPAPSTVASSASNHPSMVSSGPIPIFDPENEHHRRILRLRSVIPDFIRAVRLAVAKSHQMRQAQAQIDDSDQVATDSPE